MDAETKGIMPGEQVEYFDDIDQVAIYIGKIPEVRVMKPGYNYDLPLSIYELWPCVKQDYDEMTCPEGCTWIFDNCQPTIFKLDLKVGDIVRTNRDTDATVVAINYRDAVYTYDGVQYVNPGEYGKYKTIRKIPQQQQQEQEREFTACPDSYGHITELYDHVIQITGAPVLFGSVKGGSLTSKVSTREGQTVVVDGVHWHDITMRIYRIMEITTGWPRQDLCVYRTANIKLKGEGALDISSGIITIPIPASCTINLDFVQKWGMHNKCCVFKIHLSSNVPYLPMERPSVERTDKDQDEVLIPAGYLHIGAIYKTKLGRIIEGTFEPLALDELMRSGWW